MNSPSPTDQYRTTSPCSGWCSPRLIIENKIQVEHNEKTVGTFWCLQRRKTMLARDICYFICCMENRRRCLFYDIIRGNTRHLLDPANKELVENKNNHLILSDERMKSFGMTCNFWIFNVHGEARNVNDSVVAAQIPKLLDTVLRLRLGLMYDWNPFGSLYEMAPERTIAPRPSKSEKLEMNLSVSITPTIERWMWLQFQCITRTSDNNNSTDVSIHRRNRFACFDLDAIVKTCSSQLLFKCNIWESIYRTWIAWNVFTCPKDIFILNICSIAFIL